ncbi:MAG: hypothetical protein AAB221_02395, partial [Bacteroidota bacterium]
MKLLLINQPEDYYSLLETTISDRLCKKNQVPDLIHLFAKSMIEFETEMKKMKPLINKNTSVI